MIQDSLEALHKNIRHLETQWKRKPNTVKLLVVSKNQSLIHIKEAHGAGQVAFGESYLQEAIPKIEALKEMGIEWHFIGPIQKNKTRRIAESFSWLHSLDREIIAERLNNQRPPHLPELNVCIQVNISQESNKSGIRAEEVIPLAQQILSLPRLRLKGLMVIPKPCKNFEQQRIVFRKLRALLESLNHTLTLSLDTLSMGMSDDYVAAIAEGSTIIRIGNGIFGKNSLRKICLPREKQRLT